MKVTLIGGWHTDDARNEAWKLELDSGKKDELQQFCVELGRSLARKRHTVFVGSDDKDKSADYHVVQGMLQQLTQQNGPNGSIRLIQRIDANKDLYRDQQQDANLRRFFLAEPPDSTEKWPRAAAKIYSVRKADAVITIAGLTDTYIAGIAAMVANKPLVPVGVFGGASRELLSALKSLRDTKLPDEWNRLYSGAPDAAFVETVLRLGGLDRPRVFLGYCARAKVTASAIRTYLETGLGLAVTDWATDFESGSVILEQIQAAARSCKYGLFLFTPDDTVKTGGKSYKVPRANVVFEAGYFMNTHGPKRTLIIVQKGTRVPADYGGYIYPSLENGRDISTIEARLRETFSEDLPEGNSHSSGTSA